MTIKSTPTITDNKDPKVEQETKPQKIDPLLECLVQLTRHYGQTRSASAIRADLPIGEGRMTPDLFCEAAENIGYSAKIVKRKIAKIPTEVLPAVLILKGGKACTILSFTDKNTARIQMNGDAQIDDVPLKDLEAQYRGFALFFSPKKPTESESHKALQDGTDPAEGHWFWAIWRKNTSLYGRALIAATLVNLFGLTAPLFIMNVYDRVIPNNAIETGWVLGIGALTVFVFDFIMRTLRGYFIDLAGKRVDVVAARKVFDHVLNMKLAHRPASAGSFANMLRDFDTVRDFMASATLATLVDVPFVFFFLFIIWFLGGQIAFLLGGLMVAVLVAGLIIQIPLRKVVRQSVKSSEAKHGLLVETVGGLETIKSLGVGPTFRERYTAHSGENAELGAKSRFLSAMGMNIAAFLQQSATIIVVLLGMYLVRDAELSMGGLIACVILGGRAIAPVGQIAGLVVRWHHAASAFKTINTIMKTPVERPSTTAFLHRPDLKGGIAFDKVKFTYPKTNRPILDGVSFAIKPGEKVGIAGRVGSGKSTIAKLMLGLYDPDEGNIYADGTDTRQIDPADLRRNIGYIAQDVVLFSGSVRDNIVMARPDATDEEVLAVAKQTGVHDFISRHPQGYDAQVGERGEGFSGGQRQTIALARAFLGNPNLLICDEPTNAMDMQTEDIFARYVEQDMKDRTLVLVTHRQPLLRLIDRLILVDYGRVIADGPRDKVLEALAKGKIAVEQQKGQG